MLAGPEEVFSGMKSVRILLAGAIDAGLPVRCLSGRKIIKFAIARHRLLTRAAQNAVPSRDRKGNATYFSWGGCPHPRPTPTSACSVPRINGFTRKSRSGDRLRVWAPAPPCLRFRKVRGIDRKGAIVQVI